MIQLWLISIIVILVLHNINLYKRLYKKKDNTTKYSNTMPASLWQMQLLHKHLKKVELSDNETATVLWLDTSIFKSLKKNELSINRSTANQFIKKLVMIIQKQERD